MRFTGAISSRSSKEPDKGPPGESEIQKLNPERKKKILEKTGWATLEPGSLNLEVQDNVIFALEQLTPLWVEDAFTLSYPSPYEDVPRFRGEYWYYLADASNSQFSQETLVRRAKCPVPNRLELLAPVNIRAEFSVSDGDLLDIDLR